MDFQFSNEASDILKWVGLVFAAGFIGYFGRYVGMLIIERLRRRRAGQISTAEPAKEPASEISAPQDNKAGKDKLKLEKKRLKLEEKKTKKDQNDQSPE